MTNKQRLRRLSVLLEQVDRVYMKVTKVQEELNDLYCKLEDHAAEEERSAKDDPQGTP